MSDNLFWPTFILGAEAGLALAAMASLLCSFIAYRRKQRLLAHNAEER